MRKFQVLRNEYPKGTIVGELLDDYDSLTKERDALRTQLDKEYEKRRDLLKLHQEDARLWQIERDALRAEVAVARERLGPAGYKIVQEVAKLRAALEDIASLDSVPWLHNTRDASKCTICIAKKALGQE